MIYYYNRFCVNLSHFSINLSVSFHFIGVLAQYFYVTYFLQHWFCFVCLVFCFCAFVLLCVVFVLLCCLCSWNLCS
jgi:hypothetical protein